MRILHRTSTRSLPNRGISSRRDDPDSFRPLVSHTFSLYQIRPARLSACLPVFACLCLSVPIFEIHSDPPSHQGYTVTGRGEGQAYDTTRLRLSFASRFSISFRSRCPHHPAVRLVGRHRHCRRYRLAGWTAASREMNLRRLLCARRAAVSTSRSSPPSPRLKKEKRNAGGMGPTHEADPLRDGSSSSSPGRTSHRPRWSSNLLPCSPGRALPNPLPTGTPRPSSPRLSRHMCPRPAPFLPSGTMRATGWVDQACRSCIMPCRRRHPTPPA